MKIRMKKSLSWMLWLPIVLPLIGLLLWNPRFEIDSLLGAADEVYMDESFTLKGVTFDGWNATFKTYGREYEIDLETFMIKDFDLSDGDYSAVVESNYNFLFFTVYSKMTVDTHVDTVAPVLALEDFYEKIYLTDQVATLKVSEAASIYIDDILYASTGTDYANGVVIHITDPVDGENINEIYVVDDAGNKSNVELLIYAATVDEEYISILCGNYYIPLPLVDVESGYSFSNLDYKYNVGDSHKGLLGLVEMAGYLPQEDFCINDNLVSGHSIDYTMKATGDAANGALSTMFTRFALNVGGKDTTRAIWEDSYTKNRSNEVIEKVSRKKIVGENGIVGYIYHLQGVYYKEVDSPDKTDRYYMLIEDQKNTTVHSFELSGSPLRPYSDDVIEYFDEYMVGVLDRVIRKNSL